jgi:hypothetical protein
MAKHFEPKDTFTQRPDLRGLQSMNLGPTVGPLVAELLSGIIALLIIYVATHGLTFAGIDELSNGAIVALFSGLDSRHILRPDPESA